MAERCKGKMSHASSYGSSRADRFHSGVDAYWKNHRRNNPSLPNWQKDRRQAGGTDNPQEKYFIPDISKRTKKPVNLNSSHPNYSSIQSPDPLLRCPRNHRSYLNKMPFNKSAGILQKENDFKDDADNDADDAYDDDDDGDYYENEANTREKGHVDQVDSCVSCETCEKDNDDPDEEIDEHYRNSPAAPNFPTKYEKLPTSMIEKFRMLELAHAQLKMNQRRHLQRRYQNMMMNRRNCQDVQNREITDDATEEEDEILRHPLRKSFRQPINYGHQSSWLSYRNQENYCPIKSSQQTYQYPRKYDFRQATLETSAESYRQKKPCRYCGGTGNDQIEPISRKTNCRVHDSTKVSFNTKEKFDGESGDQGERCISGRRMNFLNPSPTNLSSQKSRRSRNTRSPDRA